ncbi:unnamed protein product [Mytilus edulis]|uniref:Uncharacterized protein n=1 Tax=Mytilus edulis TaxID=6550 RepID=A0A8S3RP66_MYTED|nr:unnamed protein product [Mytilus edulis]
MKVETYYFFLLMNVAEKLVNGQYYSKCVQPEVISFIQEPILTDKCVTAAFGSTMCNNMHGCDMYEKTGTHAYFTEVMLAVMKSVYIITECLKSKACLSIGGNPAEFYSKEEMTNALTVITSNVYVSGSLQGGGFIWSVSGQEIDNNLWIPDEPTDGTCVQIWRDKKGLDALMVLTKLPFYVSRGFSMGLTENDDTERM